MMFVLWQIDLMVVKMDGVGKSEEEWKMVLGGRGPTLEFPVDTRQVRWSGSDNQRNLT